MRKLWLVLALLSAIPALGQGHTFVPSAGVNGTQSFGVMLFQLPYANLPAEVDGNIIYCQDCQAVTPCLGGGTGAFALAQNGTYSCSDSVSLASPPAIGNITPNAGTFTTLNATTTNSGATTATTLNAGTSTLGATTAGTLNSLATTTTLITSTASTACSYNGVFYAGSSCYAKISNAVAAAVAAGGGMVYAPPGYRETITNQIELGTTSAPVMLVLASNSIVTCSVSGASAVCFNVHNASGIMGYNIGNVGAGRVGGGTIIVGATTFKAIIDTPEGLAGQTGQAFLTLRDFSITGNAASTCSEMINFEGVSDLNTIQNVHIDTFPCIGIRIASNTTNVAGPITLQNDEVNGSYCAPGGSNCNGTGNAIPVAIVSNTATILGVDIDKGNYVHPGAGSPIISVVGTSGSVSMVKVHTYLEDLLGASTLAVQIVDAKNVTVDIAQAKLGATDTAVDIAETGTAKTCNIQVRGIETDSTGNGAWAVVNHIIAANMASGTGNNNASNYALAGSQTGNYVFGGESTCGIVNGVPMPVLQDGTTVTFPVDGAQNFSAQVTLAASRLLNITNPIQGGHYTLKIIQGGAGSNNLTPGASPGCSWLVAGGGAGVLPLSTAFGAVDLLTIDVDATGHCLMTLVGKNYT